MKKILLTFLTITLIFSCSSDSSDASSEFAPSLDTHLISRVYLHESTERHVDYTYNSNNQLTEGITSNGARQTFAYHSNGLIRENAFYNSNQVWTGTLVLDYNTSGNVSKLFLVDSATEFNVNYLSSSLVEILKIDTNTDETILRFMLEMNNDLDMSNFKSYTSDNDLLYNIDFIYDSRKNVNKTISYDVNTGAEMILEYEWGNGHNYGSNQSVLLYQRMPNGMSLSDFIDLTDEGYHPGINLLSNGINPRLNHNTFRVDYTFFSNGMAKTQTTTYYDNDNQFEPNSFTYDYINKN